MRPSAYEGVPPIWRLPDARPCPCGLRRIAVAQRRGDTGRGGRLDRAVAAGRQGRRPAAALRHPRVRRHQVSARTRSRAHGSVSISVEATPPRGRAAERPARRPRPSGGARARPRLTGRGPDALRASPPAPPFPTLYPALPSPPSPSLVAFFREVPVALARLRPYLASAAGARADSVEQGLRLRECQETLVSLTILAKKYKVRPCARRGLLAPGVCSGAGAVWARALLPRRQRLGAAGRAASGAGGSGGSNGGRRRMQPACGGSATDHRCWDDRVTAADAAAARRGAAAAAAAAVALECALIITCRLPASHFAAPRPPTPQDLFWRVQKAAAVPQPQALQAGWLTFLLLKAQLLQQYPDLVRCDVFQNMCVCLGVFVFFLRV